MENAEFVSQGYVGFLFGLFCAYWAQETDRNPWLWFFFGWIWPRSPGSPWSTRTPGTWRRRAVSGRRGERGRDAGEDPE